MPASGKLIADFNPARAAGEKLTSFLRERVCSVRIPPFMHPFL